MDDIYFKTALHKKIVINSQNLDENIDNYINKYLKNKIEGKCIDEGYIKPDSIEIIKKSIGMLLGSKFNGDITYDILYTADITNPVIGNIIDCKVKFINKLGILGNNGPITIIVSKQFHNNSDFINEIKQGDVIKVEVIDKKFSLNDTEIKIVGKLWDKNKKEIISSDLSPVNDNKTNSNNNLEDNDDIEDAYDLNDLEDSDDENEQDDEQDDGQDDADEDNELEDDEEEDDVLEDDENNKVIKITNPDENMNVDEIELDEDDDDEDEDEDEDDDDDDNNI